MSRRWLLFPFCLSLLLVLVPLSSANVTLSINESATRVLFEPEATMVVLSVANPFNKLVDAHIKLDLIDPEGVVRGTTQRDHQIKSGVSTITVPVNLWMKGKVAENTRELLWYRLRYEITPAGSGHFDAVNGLVSLSQITPDIFALQVAALDKAQEGSAYRLRVHTLHPLTAQAVDGVNVEVQITFDGDERPDVVLKQYARTNDQGFATLDFQIPPNLEADDGLIEVKARRGILSERASRDLELDRDVRIIVSTDKPLYQPGQSLHTRALMFDSSRHALANHKATLKIADSENTTVFQTELTTSRFGVAAADWQVPENTRLGNYSIEVELEDDHYSHTPGYAPVKISRYDLPNFSVKVKADRTFYLPQQNAEVEVRGDYLFGQPVKRGHVRVVREAGREWNYRDQKWETEEGDKYEGEIDAAGRYVARINLSDEHEKLKEDDYSRYRDLSYAAYFTDATTNRTEETRFDLRLTKDAIHVYVMSMSHQSPDFPLELYVSTSFADGRPASSEVKISQSAGNDSAERALATTRTSKYGIAKITGLRPQTDPEEPSQVELILRARDSSGATGTHTESISLDEGPTIRVETDKALYRDGEPVHATILASQPDLALTVDVIGNKKVLQSQFVRLQNGRGSLTLPYRQDFAGLVTIAVYSPALDDREDVSQAQRTVMYPRDRDLKFAVALDQESYRPGAEASASFVTRNALSNPAESALGIVIFDKAVAERASNDGDVRDRFGFADSYCLLLDCSAAIGGVTLKDLERTDLTKPLPEGFDLVAEMLLADHRFFSDFFHSESFARYPERVFAETIDTDIAPLKHQLEFEYQTNCVYPTNQTTLKRLAFAAGIVLDELRDPWKTPYRPTFFAEDDHDVFELTSAGADKQFDTPDDFTVLRLNRPYFRFAGEAINRAVSRYHARTGQFIRNSATLKSELRNEGIDLDALRDPWGGPYQLLFQIERTRYGVFVRSAGPDKKFLPEPGDDVTVWTSWKDYSSDVQAQIDAVLNDYFKTRSRFPQSDVDLNAVLESGALSREQLRDPWNRPYYATYEQNAAYSDRVTFLSYANYGEPQKERMLLTPVTSQKSYLHLRSAGPDGKEGTEDDFTVASFSRMLAEQAGDDATPQQVVAAAPLKGSTGAISGLVIDPAGSVIPGARVTAKNARTSAEFQATTDDEGRFLIRNVPAGFYEVKFTSTGFSSAVFSNVPVRSSNITRIDARLEAGAVSGVVNVTDTSGRVMETTSTQLSSAGKYGAEYGKSAGALIRLQPGAVAQVQLATPRLREYFPETLVWQPSLETDKQGKAQLKFKLADNITTWKMSVIASTEDGQIGTVEKEIKAFQPFFVEHDPPRVLTEGDEISLPIVVRNYLDQAQTVNLSIRPENWFTLLAPATQSAAVAAGDATRTTFDLRATSSVKDGKQRITATASDANDAIEKPVTVHPDGEEKTASAGDILTDHSTLTLEIPSSLVPNSARAELKIYPNLMAHVTESVEAIMHRPYGCGEQTISSSYPSLLLLRNYKQTGRQTPMRARAESYLRAGYDRLLNYRAENGGFTYWGKGDPDLALTAYALRFLSEAREIIAVNDDVITQARAWLMKQQRTDGSWAAYDYGDKVENVRRTALLTAYIARVLAASGSSQDASSAAPSPANQATDTDAANALKKALAYLARRIEEIEEPYLLASYTLAALDAGEKERAQVSVAKLSAISHAENGARYWSLETNTPFYGWGLAGRIETTALAVHALAAYCALPNSNCADDDENRSQLINQGLLFLLRGKDQYGVWYSSQATVNVLDTLLAVLAREQARSSGAVPSAEILVNGTKVRSVELPATSNSLNPITVDLSSFMKAGTNRIEVNRPRGSATASVQAVAGYYVPWAGSEAAPTTNLRSNGASALRLVTRFDKTEGRIGDAINCHVEAERIGHSGYGMMLAEIGLPPGADVDRASMELAMKASGWGINQYDILPDRVVVYLWPQAGGLKFDFQFRPRMAMKAQSAPAEVYDYYNPEARTVVAPARFVIK